MSESTSQLIVGAKLDGSFEETTKKVKRKIGELGATANDAGKSLAGMGNGTAQSAQKIESATKSMIQSIQRTTAATEAGDKSTRAYQESLARMRGIDVAALKPYLDQLDAAKSKAAQAATANNSLGDSFAGLGSRSVIAAGAIGAVGAALSAAFSAASIKGVIDVADTFSKLSQKSGVAVEALRELNYAASLSDVSTEALGTGLRKLSQNMASAAGGGKEQAAAFAAIGVSVKGMDGALKGADVVLSEIAGKFANFSDGPEKAALAIELFGKQGADMIPLLNSGTSGLSEMAKEAAELGIVFGSDLAKNSEAFNDNLTRIQTSSEGAKIAIANELLPTLNYLAQAFLDAQKAGSGFGSFIGGALKTIIEAATILYSDVEFVLKGIGREFGAIGAQVVALGKLDIKGFNAISAAVKEDGVRARAELDKFQYDLLNAGILSSKAGAGRGTATDPRLLGSTQTTAPIIAATAAAKELREVVNKAAKEDIAAFRLMADLKTKFQGEEMARIEKTREELEKTMEAYAKASEAGVSNAIAAATAAETELANYGLLKSAVQELTLTNLEQARESAAMAGEDVANIEKRIAAQKRLIAATKGVEVRTASDNAAKEAAAEWKKTSDSINSTLTDALMRGFESGKGFAKSLRDTVVNMFKTLVLRPIISAVMSPISAAITGGLGLSGAAQAAGGLSTASTAMSGLSLAMSSFGTSFMSGLSTTFASGFSTLGLAVEGGLASIATGTATGISAGIGQALGAVAGPLAIGAGVLAALGAFRSTKQTGTGISGTLGNDASLTGFNEMRKSGYLFGGPEYRDELKALDPLMAKALTSDFAAIKAAATGAATALGLASTSVSGFTKAFRIEFTGDKAKDEALYKDLLAGTADDLARGILGSYKETIATVIEEIQTGSWSDGSDATFSSVERQVKTTAYTPSEFAREGETASQTLTRLATSITLVNGMSDLLGNALLSVGLSGANTASLLIDAFGGAESYAAQMGSYYTNFYDQAERTAKLTDSTSKAFEALGLSMPKLDESARDVYRSLVEEAAAKDMTVESNRTAYASLIALQGPMNELAPAFDDLSDSMTSAAKAAALAATSQMTWQDKINAITGDPEAIAASRSYAKQRDLASTTDPLTKALIETAYQYEDEVAARQKQTDLMALQDEAMQSWITTQQAVTDAQRQYASVLKNTIGTLKDFLSSLNVGSTPSQRLSGARSDFGNLAARAASGDASVYDKLAPAAKSFLDISKNYSKSIQDYKRDEAAVRNSLQSVISVNQQELDKLPAEISAASNPTREAWVALKEATDKEAMAHILVTAMSVDQIAAQARLNGTTKSLETRYLELITTLPNGEALNKTFWDTMDLAIKTFVPATEADFGFADSFAATTGAADALTAALDPMGIDPKKLALSLGISEEAAKALAFALSATGVNPDDLATALGLTGSAADALTIALATSGIEPAALAVSLGLTGIAADSLAKALEPSSIKVASLAEALSLPDTAARILGVALTDYAARISAAVVPTISTPTASTAYGAGPISDAYQTLFGRTPDAVGAEFWKASGLTGSALFDGIRAGAQGSDIDAKKLRGFAVGTNYVTQDGPAYLHQGEAVVPKAYNPAIATQARDEAVVAEIRALREEVTLLRSEAKAGQNAIAHNTRKSAEALDKFDIDGLPATRS